MKNFKKMTLFGLITFTSAGLIGFSTAYNNGNDLYEVKASKEYVLTIDGNTDLNNIRTKDGNKIEFEFINYKPVPNALGKFTEMRMKTPLNGIHYVNIFTEQLNTYFYGHYYYQYKDGSRLEVCEYDDLVNFNIFAGSDSCVGRLPNIVDLVSNGEDVIKQIDFEYTCEEKQQNLSMYYQEGNKIEIIRAGTSEITYEKLNYNKKDSMYDRLLYDGEVFLEVGDRFRIKREDGICATIDNTDWMNKHSDYSTPLSDYFEVQADSWMLVKLRSRVKPHVDVVGPDASTSTIEYEKLPPKYTFTLNFNFEERIPSGYRPVIFSDIPGYEGAKPGMTDLEKIKQMDKTSCTTNDPNRKKWKLDMPGREGYGDYIFHIYVLEYGKPYDRSMPEIGVVVELSSNNKVSIGEFLTKEESYYNLHVQTPEQYYPAVGDFGLYDVSNPLNRWLYKKAYGTNNEYRTIQGIYSGTVLEARQLLNGELYIGKLSVKPGSQQYGITIKDNKIYANTDILDLRLYIISYEGDATTPNRYVNIQVESNPVGIITSESGTVVGIG